MPIYSPIKPSRAQVKPTTKNYVIPLNSILQNDNRSIKAVADSLRIRGYTFIRLPTNITQQIDIRLKLMESFFSKPKESKKKYFKAPIFGYFDVNHKESFRVLTGSRLDEQQFPADLVKVKQFIHTIDQIMYSLSLSLSKELFPKILSEADKVDIPFFDMKNQWGMFDIAKYHNDGTRKEINCKEHYDPGLLSLSLRSTEPGLQLKNEFGRWIKAPTDKSIAVLWAGKAATKINPKIKPGIHRVVNPQVSGKPRISMWHEICTRAQEHRELLNKVKNVKSVKEEFDPYVSQSATGIPTSKTMMDPETMRKMDTRYKYIHTIRDLKDLSPEAKRVFQSAAWMGKYEAPVIMKKKTDPQEYEDKTGIPFSKSR